MIFLINPKLASILKKYNYWNSETMQESKMVENPTTPYIIKVEVPTGTHMDAIDLCGMTTTEIEEMIAKIGVNGLINYVDNEENWEED